MMAHTMERAASARAGRKHTPTATVLLKVTSSNEDYSAGCDYAVVEMTPPLAQQCLMRIALLKELKSRQDALHEMHYWDNEPRFFRWFDGLETLRDVELQEPVDQVLDKHSSCIPDAPIRIPEDAVQGTDCLYMVVGENEVYWEAIPRHAAIRVSTAEIDRKTLEKVARGGLRRIGEQGGKRK